VKLHPHKIPEPVREVCQTLERAGHRTWVVGGCIRDLFMGREISDWDLATSALPGQVQAAFKRTFPTGIEHGTVTVLHRGEAYEVTTLRGEGAYTDGRRPDEVTLGVDIDEDLARRDFTVNAIAYDPLTNRVVDPHRGIDDLHARVIRAVGDPAARFGEDGLRVLRAARFCATLEFTLDDATRAAITPSLETFAKVSPERVHEEWRKAFEKSDRPSLAFQIMRDTGILERSCAPLASLEAGAWSATMRRLDQTPKRHVLRLAALLLDVPWRRGQLDGWLRGFRASNPERKAVAHLVDVGLPPDRVTLSDEGVRRWMSEVGRDALDDVLALGRAHGRDVDPLAESVRAELDAGTPLSTTELAVDGKDVMTALDCKPGRVIGDVLARLLERVHEDPALADAPRLRAAIEDAYRDVKGTS